MKIYRVENAKGFGMYNTQYSPDHVRWDMQGAPLHPTPYEDSALMCAMEEAWGCYGIKKYHYFGFESVKQLLRWVYRREWHIELDRAGFSVSVFHADGVSGNTQAVYLKDTREENLMTINLLEIQDHV